MSSRIFTLPLILAMPEQIRSGNAVAEIGRIFDLAGLQREYLRYRVHDYADQQASGGAVNLRPR